MENKLFIGLSDKTNYPPKDQFYNPSNLYPEYPFSNQDISIENEVYDMVRKGFVSLGLDIENYGKREWNPLSKFIQEGDTIILKPNWVMHKNKNKDFVDNLDCLVTHPSIVRAVVDYVIIALKGTGRIIVADAPMQGCDLESLFIKVGYDHLVEFYKSKKKNIEWLDLRHVQVVTNGRVITDTIPINDIEESIIIDLEHKSKHNKKEGLKYKVSDYAESETNKYHRNSSHQYSINKLVLEADVFINLPKPKCHRLAGITGAQKNIVGVIFDKASLPHRTIGSKSEGGDEYPQRSKIKDIYTKLEEFKLGQIDKGNRIFSFILQVILAALYFIIRFFFKDKVMIGSWHGNDTIWRTVADLNYIVKYADKNGIIQNQPQRKFLNISDMIISGQGDGPIGPHPKYLGMILISENSVLMDYTISKIMGFDYEKIPGMTESVNECLAMKNNFIYSNLGEFNNIDARTFMPSKEWSFTPHKSWRGNIEK